MRGPSSNIRRSTEACGVPKSRSACKSLFPATRPEFTPHPSRPPKRARRAARGLDRADPLKHRNNLGRALLKEGSCESTLAQATARRGPVDESTGALRLPRGFALSRA
jgi:hypothetical protein